MALGRSGPDQIGAADHLVERPQAQSGHDLAQFLGDVEEIIDHMFGRAGEAGAKHRILGSDPDRAGIEMAFAHHDAAGGDERRGGEAIFVRSEQSGDGDVAAGPEAPVGLDADSAAQAVHYQHLLSLGQADLPGQAGMGQRGQRRGAGAAFIAGDGDMIGEALGHARRTTTSIRSRIWRSSSTICAA
jgi:hypothetical protein